MAIPYDPYWLKVLLAMELAKAEKLEARAKARRIKKTAGPPHGPAPPAPKGPTGSEPARPRPHHHKSSPAIDRAKRALADIYRHGVPDQATEPNKSLCQKGADWLKQKKLQPVDNRTFLRAAERSK